MVAPERHEQGRITDEGIAKLRERIGKGFDARQSWWTEINRDTIWHIGRAVYQTVWTENQLGERTTIGEAIVELPKSRH